MKNARSHPDRCYVLCVSFNTKLSVLILYPYLFYSSDHYTHLFISCVPMFSVLLFDYICPRIIYVYSVFFPCNKCTVCYSYLFFIYHTDVKHLLVCRDRMLATVLVCSFGQRLLHFPNLLDQTARSLPLFLLLHRC